MNKQPRKGLQDITTRSGLAAGEIQNPQRRFLRVASLELKKSLCRKVRDAASRRVEEMDLAIAALDAEKTLLLSDGQDAGRPPAARRSAPHSLEATQVQGRRGFALRYCGRSPRKEDHDNARDH